jgi:hypothetical protein
MVTTENFTRVNNDINGNPRYVIHFLDLLTDKEQDEIKANARPFQFINDMYNEAINKAKTIGGKKYRGKDFGGGIVFQSYNLYDTAKDINELLK